MQDMQTHLEKLHRDAVDCALISKRATDAQKKELFDRLADHLYFILLLARVTKNGRAAWNSAVVENRRSRDP